MNKVFFKADLKMKSPLALGSGKDDYTDNDVLVDNSGKPYLPGTSIAGAVRHFLKDNNIDVNTVFGYSTKEADAESNIIIYEAFPKPGREFVKNFRDGVAIDLEDGVSQDTAKFDYEVFEPTGSFELRIEVDGEKVNKWIEIFNLIISGINKGEIQFGAKTTRGIGEFETENAMYFDCNDINDYIDFEWNTSKFIKYDKFKECGLNDKEYKYDFTVKSFIIIANNATLEKNTNNKLIASEQLQGFYIDNNKIAPRCEIPGSSWSGVFRHHFYKILKTIGENTLLQQVGIMRIDNFLNEVFGSTEKASKIKFKNSYIEINKPGENDPNKATLINTTRNAIDRFTGGSSDGMLYTNRLAFGGKTTLSISLKPGIENEELVKSLIEQTVKDIDDGYVNIGGLGGVGGGILGRC